MTFWWLGLCVLAAAAALVLWGDRRLTVSRYSFRSPKLTAPVRLVQLSDLHNRQFGRDNARLIRAVRAARPDLVVMTGDLQDRRLPYRPASTRLLVELARQFPVYFVFGNQEVRGRHERRLERELAAGGVRVLDNRQETVRVNGQTLSLLGMNDYEDPRHGLLPYAAGRALLRRFERAPGFRLLLSHYPHYFAHYRRAYQYSRFDIDLVLAGHAHGGLIRLPLLPGVIAPGQWLFPRYTAGLYRANGSAMLVSRGLGDSGLPRRIGNSPELVVLDLLPEPAGQPNPAAQ